MRHAPEQAPGPRIAWVSGEARDAWAERISRAATAWNWIEWLSVHHGLRRAAVLPAMRGRDEAWRALWRECRLDVREVTLPDGNGGTVLLIADGAAARRRFLKALDAGDSGTLMALQGVPDSCRAENAAWPAGLASPIAGLAAMLGARGGGERVPPPGLSNPFWSWAGIRPFFHQPRALPCGDTAAFAAAAAEIGRRSGAGGEMAWTEEILSWPVQWSIRHGIAEIKTPILKAVFPFERGLPNMVIEVEGSAYPGEGAKGLRFPYRVSSGIARTGSRGFQRGLDEVGGAAAERPDSGIAGDWLHRDNGFSSAQAMQARHEPITRLARRFLAGRAGRVLDLGCGNGVLVRAICAGGEGLTACGVDRNPRALRHAQALSGGQGEFWQADIADRALWRKAGTCALVLLAVPRLVEANRETARTLISDALQSGAGLLLYDHDENPAARIADACETFGLVIASHEGGSCAITVARPAWTGTPVQWPPDVRRKRRGTGIDWGLIARPEQPEASLAAIRLLNGGETAGEAASHQRRGLKPPPHTAFDGRVWIQNRDGRGLSNPTAAAADCGHPNIARAVELLSLWPEAALAFPHCVHTIQPWCDLSKTPEEWRRKPGSSSHSLDAETGVIMVSVDSGVALAVALVHEMAHHKLRSLGVFIDGARRIVANPGDKLYFSPVKNRGRPMTALLHAQFSFIHVLAFEGMLLSRGGLQDGQRRAFLSRFRWHADLMEQGHREIEANIETGREGEAFIASFLDWSGMVIRQSRAMLVELTEAGEAA